MGAGVTERINKCIKFPGGIMTVGPDSEFSDKDIEQKRRELAKRWHQSLSQVTDYEAISMLRKECP